MRKNEKQMRQRDIHRGRNRQREKDSAVQAKSGTEAQT